MKPESHQADLAERCRARYAALAAECEAGGIDPAEIERSRAFCTRHHRGRAWLKTRAYRPTGVALGYPLPGTQYEQVLDELCERTDQWLRALTGSDQAALARVPVRALHVTLVNYDHFDVKSEKAPIRHLRRSQWKAVKALMTRQQCGPVTLEFDGLLLSAHGRLMVRGCPADVRLFELKEALRSHLPFLQTNYPVTTHIKLGHLITPLAAQPFRELLEWLKQESSHACGSVEFTDAYTALGRIPL